MSFVIYSFPAPDFAVIEASLRGIGSSVQRAERSLIVRSGAARVRVVDYTDSSSPNAQFVVVSGRSGLLSSVLCWPFDRGLARQVRNRLLEAGAKPVTATETPTPQKPN